jgi:hypothetical protein
MTPPSSIYSSDIYLESTYVNLNIILDVYSFQGYTYGVWLEFNLQASVANDASTFGCHATSNRNRQYARNAKAHIGTAHANLRRKSGLVVGKSGRRTATLLAAFHSVWLGGLTGKEVALIIVRSRNGNLKRL